MAKHRITISLSDITVQKVDGLIDKKKIRNRSHAIEHLIQQSLQPVIHTAAILAGDAHPHKHGVRPLTLLNEVPLIFHTLELLKKHGVEQVVILTNQPGKAIEKMVGSGERWGMRVFYIYENSPRGTAGALKQAEKVIGAVPFFVLAGDVWTSINLQDLAHFHKQMEGVVTVAVKPRPQPAEYDSVFMQGNLIVDFQHSDKDQLVGIVNTGVYVCEPEIFSYISNQTPTSLERDVFPVLARNKQLNAFTFQGIWYDISLDENYKEVLAGMKQAQTIISGA